MSVKYLKLFKAGACAGLSLAIGEVEKPPAGVKPSEAREK